MLTVAAVTLALLVGQLSAPSYFNRPLPPQCHGRTPVFKFQKLPTNIIGEADVATCTIRYDVYSGMLYWQPELLCQLAAHETGHILGEEHVLDPNDIMYPVMTLKLIGPRYCRYVDDLLRFGL